MDHRRYRHSWVADDLVTELFSPNTPARFENLEEHSVAAGFGEIQADVSETLSAAAGMRWWRSAGEWYPAPRLLLSFRPRPDFRIEASASRRLQFTTALEEPIEGSIHPPEFLLESPRRVNLLAVSAERDRVELPFTDAEARIRLQGFWKKYPDRRILSRDLLQENPRAGVAVAPDSFPVFDPVVGTAYGASLAFRARFAVDGLVQGSYTWQRSRELVETEWSPTSWDTPHNVALFASLGVLPAVSLNAAFRAHSGRATTPVLARLFVPDSEFARKLASRFIAGDRNSIRVDPYHRLDLGVRHSWKGGGAEWTLFGQVLNVLASDNPIDYDWPQFFQKVEDGFAGGGFRTGLPVIPSVGVEIRW